MKNISHIGTTEVIDLPEAGVFGVSAKVDTGADSSAIWASDIVERNDELSFVLFDKQSPHYTGKIISAKTYRTTLIKNSFGQVERRYKVALPAVVAGRKIRATFTLANRSNNRYPVLIGRKTLHGKFLVDVRRKLEKSSYDILMLSTKRTKVTQRYADNIVTSSTKLNITYMTYADLDYVMGLPQSRITIRDTGRDIASFDMMYFKTTAQYRFDTTSQFMDVAAATARYLEKRNVPFIDRAIKYFPTTSKLYQYMLLENSAMRVPPSVFMMREALVGAYGYIVKQIGLPFVLKDIHGNKGEHNYLIKNEASFKRAIKDTETDNIQLVAQGFIPNDGDYRVLVFGKEIALVIYRNRLDTGTHLNNTSQGAAATIVSVETLPATVQRACIEAAKLLERQIAGVDIVRDKLSGMWYCLEVNDGPQLASGSFVTEKQAAIARYLERKLT